jgi:hypothetical protein
VGVIERRWTLHAVNEDNRRTANAMVEGPMIGPGDAPVEVVPADQLTGAVSLLATFVDDEPCSLDHHGHCQAHDWFAEGECNVARARRLVGGQGA